MPAAEDHATFLGVTDGARSGHRTQRPTRILCHGLMGEDEEEQSHHLSWGVSHEIELLAQKGKTQETLRENTALGAPARQNNGEVRVMGETEVKMKKKEASGDKSEISKHPAVIEPLWWWTWA